MEKRRDYGSIQLTLQPCRVDRDLCTSRVQPHLQAKADTNQLVTYVVIGCCLRDVMREDPMEATQIVVSDLTTERVLPSNCEVVDPLYLNVVCCHQA